MAESESYTRFLNPSVLHFQKMGLELKCPLCSCVTNSSQIRQDCFVCKSPYVDRDLRPAPYMKNMVSIYKIMDAAFSANVFQSFSQSHLTDEKFPMSQSPVSANTVDKLPNGNETCKSKPVDDSLRPTEIKRPTESGKQKESREVKIGQQRIVLSQVTQTLPDSPPSFGETKDSDGHSSGHGGQNAAERLPTKCTIKKESEDGTNIKLYRGSVPQDEENGARETKRQKLEFGSHNVVVNGVNAKPIYSDSEGGCKPTGPFFCAQPASTPVCLDENQAFICAFCQTSRITEGSGPIVHIANRKEVAADELSQPNVVHVHRKCMEWAPQVYFVGETVMNLESELARGAKLKCSHCGLKGAALGCYSGSCRKTYHVPCAVDISNCRWDYEGHRVLCPTHTSTRFPNERSMRGKKLAMNHSSTTQMANEQTKVWAASAGATSELVLCGSALSAEEKNLLSKFARISGVTVSKNWKPNVTHVIASTDEMGACSRTLKFLMAILNGTWVLKIDWIKACMDAMALVSEEPYELSTDIHGCQDGPKNGRLKVMEKTPKLFSDLNFYFSGDFVPSYKGSLEELVLAAGGTVLTNSTLVSQGCNEGIFSSTTLVVYSLDPPPNMESEVASSVVIEERRKEAEALGEQFGSWVISHTWILESIAASKLQPVAC
ncbi:BRCT domain [Macleaya cordata]|uniref:BRCT domain n=1 Tax=Macleaya cordata TaxID=56857 RepID=A0A200QN00_MACCD|nr:BRCT domain [Macleaya cordata]